jgi:hypothetical protein
MLYDPESHPKMSGNLPKRQLISTDARPNPYCSGVTHGGGDRQGGPLGVALEEPPSLRFHPPPHGLG